MSKTQISTLSVAIFAAVYAVFNGHKYSQWRCFSKRVTCSLITGHINDDLLDKNGKMIHSLNNINSKTHFISLYFDIIFSSILS